MYYSSSKSNFYLCISHGLTWSTWLIRCLNSTLFCWMSYPSGLTLLSMGWNPIHSLLLDIRNQTCTSPLNMSHVGGKGFRDTYQEAIHVRWPLIMSRVRAYFFLGTYLEIGHACIPLSKSSIGKIISWDLPRNKTCTHLFKDSLHKR